VHRDEFNFVEAHRDHVAEHADAMLESMNAPAAAPSGRYRYYM
jgi:hypothetical protein